MSAGDEESSEPRGSIAAYAALVRVPNLFTAPPDVLLGAALAASAGERVGVPPGDGGVDVATVAGLAIASVLLYAAGTALNDAFDAPIDAEERPERPVPSGAISRAAAFGVGVGLLAAGVVAAALAAGPTGGVVAALLALAIVLYDGVLKGTAVGFLTMGSTRGLNVALGTVAAGVPTRLPPGALVVPVVVAAYVAAVTYMAAGETTTGGRRAVTAAGVAAAGAALFALGYLLRSDPGPLALAAGVAFAAAFARRVGRALLAAYADPSPATIGPAVGAAVTGLVLLDAALAAVAGANWAVAAGAFLVPAAVLSRTFDVS